MIEMLIRIPGPIFLILFIGLALVCIIVGWWWANADGSAEYLLPDLTSLNLDAVAIEVLRGGSTSGMQRPHLERTYYELEQLHLVRTRTGRHRAWTATITMAIVIGAVGGTKLYFGITRGRPVLFLVCLLILSLIMLFHFLRPWENRTRLGRRYLKSLAKEQSVAE